MCVVSPLDARGILGPGCTASDTELVALIDQLRTMSSVIGEIYRSGQGNVAANVNGLSDAEREDYEERAALLEFDAKLSRATAERLAVAAVIPFRGRKPCGPSSTAASRRTSKPVT